MRAKTFKNFLTEALKISQVRDLYKEWKRVGGDRRYSEIFGGKHRIYLPFNMTDTQKRVPPDMAREIEDAIVPAGYRIESVENNLASKDGDKRVTKITKVLNSLGEIELLKMYSHELSKYVKGDASDFLVVVSRHPYDIAGMSTDRGWTSCMDMYHGGDHFMMNDIKEGTIIAYLIKKEDPNIEHPLARTIIRPYINSETSDIILHAEEIHGTYVSGFMETVKKWLDSFQSIKSGKYELHCNLYKNSISTFIKFTGNVEQDLKMVDIKNYNILEDGSINVYQDVDLHTNSFGGNISMIFKFNEVFGNFNIERCGLTTLSGLPKYVMGNLTLYDNDKKIPDMSGGPENVKGEISIGNFGLMSLNKFPNKCGKDITIHNNPIKNLNGLPEICNGNLDIRYCDELESLEGCSKYVRGNFYLNYNAKFKYLNLIERVPPKEVQGEYILNGHQILSRSFTSRKILFSDTK